MTELKALNGSKSDLEFVIAASQSFTRYCQGLIRSGNACDITQAYDELQLRAKELMKCDYTTSYTHPVVEVSPSDIFEKLYVLCTEKSKGFFCLSCFFLHGVLLVMQYTSFEIEMWR